MEMSSFTLAPPSSSSTPVCFFNNYLESKHFRPSISSPKALNPWIQSKRLLHVKALKGPLEDRTTLSSNWEIAGITSAPRLPRFEELDTTNMLLRQRIIFLSFPIDETTADFVISQLLLLDAEDSKKDIKLFINCPGGSVTSAMGIYDAMKQCKADVSTICMGLAAYMGSFLLAAGTKGKRYCMPNARLMIHETSVGGGGDLTDFGIRKREYMYNKTKINRILSRITGKPEKQIKSDMDWEYFLNPWEAKEYGLVDAVIDDGKPGLVAPIGSTDPPPMPETWYVWNPLRIPKENLPSEHKLLQNRQTSDEEKGTPQEKDASTPV